jgi:hypothetical protein
MLKASPTLRVAFTVAALAASLLAACSDAPTGTLARSMRVAAPTGDLIPGAQTSTVCKVAPFGSYSFTMSDNPNFIQTAGWAGTMLVSNPFTVAAGQCLDILSGGVTLDRVYVTEINIPSNIKLDHIVLQAKGGDCAVEPFFCPQTITGSPFATFEMFAGLGYRVTFYNISIGAACTSGIWKKKTNLWSHTSYTTGMSFNTVFGVVGSPNAFNPDRTLLSAVGSNGGGFDALGRQAVAGLLSSSYGLNYGMTPSEVIAAVHDAIVSGNYLATKTMLEALNGQGCPLS